MENTWLGYIQPLNGLVSDDTLAASGATALSIFQGQQYRVGFYIVGFGLEYDKAAFETAGLDPDSPPTTWDAFLDALRQDQEHGDHSALRRDQGRLLRRVVLRQLADPEPEQPGRRAQPLHRRARLARPAVPRALGQAAGALRQRLHQRRHQLARALPGHPAHRDRQGRDDDQHHRGAAGRAGDPRRPARLHDPADLRDGLHGRHPDHRHAGLLHPDQTPTMRRAPPRSSSSCTRRIA